MTPEHRTQILIARTADYYGIMRTTIFTFLGLAALLHLGPDTWSLPIAALVIATTAYGILAGGTALDDIINLRADMDDTMSETSYGVGVKARDLPTLKLISSALLGLIGVAELLAVIL